MAARGDRARRWTAAAAPWVLGLLLAGAVANRASSTPLHEQLDEAEAPAEASDAAQETAKERTLGALYAELAELRNAELRKSLDELWAASPDLALDALVLRAGRETPPILSGPRRAARDTLRAEASRWVVERIGGDLAERARLLAHLAERIRGKSSASSVACAAMQLAGELRLYELAGAIAPRLGSERPELRSAARAALFALYLRWFTDAAEFEAFETRHRGRANGELFLEATAHYEQLARERLVELFDLDPARAAAGLTDPDPRIRAAAARSTARAMSAARTGEEEGVRRLLVRLDDEEDAGAHHALLEAILGALSDSPPDSPLVRDARRAIAGGISADHPGQQAAIAHALGRLPWVAGKEPATDCVLRGIEILDQQLRDTLLADELVDRDVIAIALRALQSLCGIARGAELDPAAAVPGLRERVLALALEPRELESVRVAATLLLPTLALPGDALRVMAVLREASRKPELAYAAVSALGDLAKELDPAGEEGVALRETLADVASAESADLRRRALGYLLDEPLASGVAADRPALFVEWLRNETLPELQTELLALVASSCSPAELDLLLAMESFDALVKRGPGRVGEVAAVLRALAPGDPERVFRSAQRMVAIDDKATEARRLQVALELVADLSEDEAQALSPDRQRTVVAWALAFREKGGATTTIGHGAGHFPRRLVRVHLAGASAGAEQAGLDAYARARFLSDLLSVAPSSIDPLEIEREFESALAFADAKPAELDPARVRRSRARFRVLQEDWVGALDDYRWVLALEPERDPALGKALDLSDLRDAAELCVELCRAEPEPLRPPAGEAFDWTVLLLEREEWTGEATPVRMQDLHDLVQRAALARDAERQARVAELFADLPALPLAVEGAQAETSLPPGSLVAGPFVGLAQDRARLAELHELASQVAALGRALQAEAEAEAATPDVGEETRSGEPEPPVPAPNGDGAAHDPAREPGPSTAARKGRRDA